MLTGKKLLLGSLGLMSASLAVTPTAIAASGMTEVSGPKTTTLEASMVVPQTTCKLALLAQAEKPAAYGREKIIGKVYSVLGDNVYMQLDNGSTYIANLSMWERGKLGNIIGRRLVVTPYYCNRANLDTTLYYTTPAAIPVPPLVFSENAPANPPLTPRPEMTAPQQEAPAQQPREIIPQTW